MIIGTIAFAVQIYTDFLGYSLIAKGSALLLGFELVWNFNRPYWAISVQDFWRKWHISLSNWLRDYLYISLGGSKGSNLQTARNLFITMLLGGLWHGANWTFVIWGAWHGIALIVERLTINTINKLPKLGRWFITMLIVLVGWFLFSVLASLKDPKAGGIA